MRVAAAMKAIQGLYTADHCCNASIEAIDISGWEKVIMRLAEGLHDGSIKPEDLDEQAIKETYSDLNKKAKAGYGKEWLKVNEDTGEPDPVVLKMQQNLYKFSGAKSLAQLEELNSRMYKNGKRLSWDEFKEEALKVNKDYNLNHAQAEWQTASQAGQHAYNWAQYQRNKAQYPNLKYKTQGDDRVRPEHEELDGIVAPIDSDFWKKYYPPNGWRCRCYVVQTAEKPTRDIPESIPSVPVEFRINVAEQGQVFNESDTKDAKAHSYFQLAKAVGGRQLKVSFEKSKLAAPYNKGVHRSFNGKGSVDINPFADLTDLKTNLKSAITVADNLGVNIKIRPHIDANIVPGKNPEYEIGGKLAELKTPTSYQAVKGRLRSANKQGAESVVFNLDEFEKWEPKPLYDAINGQLTSFKTAKDGTIYIVYGNGAIEINMKDFYAGKRDDIINLLKGLRAAN